MAWGQGPELGHWAVGRPWVGRGTADRPDLNGSAVALYEDVPAPRKGQRGSGGRRDSGACLPFNLQWLRKTLTCLYVQRKYAQPHVCG